MMEYGTKLEEMGEWVDNEEIDGLCKACFVLQISTVVQNE
jgi:hypothetical protein